MRWRRAWRGEGGATTTTGCGKVKEAGRKDQRGGGMEWRWRSEQQRSCSSENECESEDEGDNERRLGREGEGQRMGLRDLGIYT